VNSMLRMTPGLLALAGWLVAAPVAALEIIMKEDFTKGVIKEDQLVRLVDNAIFLVDTSSSTNQEYHDTGKSKLQIGVEEFKKRNDYFPEIGHRFAIYEYTKWREVLAPQTYERDKVAAAIATISEKGSGLTPLAKGIENVEEVVKTLSGRTALFLFYDGQYTGHDPNPALSRLVHENDVCLLIISSAGEKENAQMEQNVARLNACSRVIPLDDYLARPEYMSGALFDVVATEKVVTTSQQRIGDVVVENILFDFDKTEFTKADLAELDELGAFLTKHPSAYAALAGYTDNVGSEEYNEHLSRARTEEVANYLMTKHGIDKSRLVLHWYGSDNPVASNATDEGRALNRRVESVIGGF